MQRSARSTSYIYSSSTRFWLSAGRRRRWGRSRCTCSRTARRRSRRSAARGCRSARGWPCRQIHAHAGADGGDVPGAQHGDDFFQRFSTISLLMMTSVWSACRYSATSWAYFRSMASSLMPMAKVRIGLPSFLAADGADQGGVQAAGKQEADGGVGVQPLIHAGDELFADVGQMVSRSSWHVRVTSAMSRSGQTCRRSSSCRGKGMDLFAQPDEVLRPRWQRRCGRTRSSRRTAGGCRWGRGRR